MTVYEGSNRVTSPYGMRTLNGKTAMHNGIDIAKGKDSKQRACIAGVVESVNIGYNGGRGNNVVIRQDTKRGIVRVRHQHVTSILVKKGQTVTPTTYVSTEGVTGDVTGSHEHFEVTVNGVVVNPAHWLGIANAIGTYPQNDQVYNYGTDSYETGKPETNSNQEDDNMYRLYETTFASDNYDKAKAEFDKIVNAGGRPGMSYAASDGQYHVGTVLMATGSPEALWENMAPNRFIG